LDVRLVVSLDEEGNQGAAFAELAANREAFDAVLVVSNDSDNPLCAQLASELEVVALDAGHVLDRTLHPRYVPGSPQLEASGFMTEYLRQVSSPAPQPPHELEGQLVRVPGEAPVFYVERGTARPLMHRDLLELFDEPPRAIDRDDLVSLPPGVPIFAVHERFVGTFILIDGMKRPVQLALQLVACDDTILADVPVDNRPVRWYPGAGDRP
jgi:hypothetical protein